MPQQVIIGLTNPKSPTNVGAIARAAGCFQADAIFYTGKRYQRAAKFHTDTKNAISRIPLKPIDSLLSIPKSGHKIICVDLIEGATPLPEFDHPENAIYIFGAEDGTISQEVIDNADGAVYIPTIGCLNLAATVNVVLYDRLSKSASYQAGDTLIKESRDTNNKVKYNPR